MTLETLPADLIRSFVTDLRTRDIRSVPSFIAAFAKDVLLQKGVYTNEGIRILTRRLDFNPNYSIQIPDFLAFAEKTQGFYGRNPKFLSDPLGYSSIKSFFNDLRLNKSSTTRLFYPDTFIRYYLPHKCRGNLALEVFREASPYSSFGFFMFAGRDSYQNLFLEEIRESLNKK